MPLHRAIRDLELRCFSKFAVAFGPARVYNSRVSNSYRQLINQVDELTARLSALYARHLVCRAGCSGCCHHHLSVFAVEADAVREAIVALPNQVLAVIHQQAREVSEREAAGESVACPLLVENRCSIYESRPLICRTQGLPLLLEAEDGSQEVDFCPLNFTAPEAIDDLDETHLVSLDDLNLKLAIVNLQHCRETGIADEASGERQKMADIVLQSAIH
jgi:Fe-S-cluster containining protein